MPCRRLQPVTEKYFHKFSSLIGGSRKKGKHCPEANYTVSFFWKIEMFCRSRKRLHDLPPFFASQKNSTVFSRPKILFTHDVPRCSLTHGDFILLVTSARSHESLRNIYRKVYMNIDFIKESSKLSLVFTYVAT